MQLTRTFARPLLASIFVAGGIDALKSPEDRAKHASHLLDRVTDSVPEPLNDAVTLVKLNAGVQVAAGTLLAVNKLPRLSSLALAGTLVPTTIGAHAFWMYEDPQQKATQRIQFFKNCAILGGLILSVFDGSLTRRQAMQLAKTAVAAHEKKEVAAKESGVAKEAATKRLALAGEAASKGAAMATQVAGKQLSVAKEAAAKGLTKGTAGVLVAKEAASKRAAVAGQTMATRAAEAAKLGEKGKSVALAKVTKIGSLLALVKGLL